MTYSIGSLCTGYGGLDMGVQMALGPARLAWVSDIEPGPCQILAHHHPGVPNLGDMTTIDWTSVEPVDVITGGTPCQDLSTAGRRAGMKPGTRSGLWESMFHAVSIIRPHLVIWENVRGAYSADAFSLMEPDPGRVGDGPRRPVLRALGRVLGDLAGIWYDAQWVGVRASDVGAPHQRYRVFVAAHPQGDTWWLHHGDRPNASDAQSVGHERRRGARDGRDRPAHSGGSDVTLLPTPRTENNENRQSAGYGPNLGGALLPTPVTDPVSGNGHARDLGTEIRTLPTPTATRYGRNKSESEGAAVRYGLDSIDRLLPTPMVSDEKDPGPADSTRHTPQLRALPMLLPTPSVADVEGGRKTRSGDRNGELLLNGIAAEKQFGQYAPAIHRWEQATRPAPDPTEGGRLSPRFVEWMQGLPAGHVTDCGLRRVQELRALGNGVVPQQAARAVQLMRGRETTCQTTA